MSKYLLIIALILASVFFGFKIKENYALHQYLKAEVQELEARKQNILKEKESLEQNLKAEERDKSLEREARLMLGLKKEGEKVILVIPPEETQGQNQNLTQNNKLNQNNQEANQSLSFFQKIWLNLLELVNKIKE